MRTISNHFLQLEIQNPYHYDTLPSSMLIQNWVEAANEQNGESSVTLRFVDENEGLSLNKDYRQKSYATNILSFVFDAPILPDGIELNTASHLGDLVLCVPVIEKEALTQQKSFEQHCAHLIIHGMLHLQGYDHIEESQAHIMESLEINILEKLDYPNPYTST